MKKTIPFIKDICFDTNIDSITSISLEHNLSLENSDSIVGNFNISGKYKINSISINEEDFSYDLPFDITLDDKYDVNKIIIDIDDFYYEIIDNNILRVHIDVLIDNLVYLKNEVLEEDTRNNKVVDNVADNSDLIVTNDKDESYSMYKVHIIRDNQTLDDLSKMYNVSKEDIELYNSTNNITIGSKLIIPFSNE